MEIIHHTLNLFDLGVGLLSFLFGSVTARKLLGKGQMRSVGILLQVSLLVLKMAKHYYETHPEAKKHVDEKLHTVIDKLHVEVHQQALTASGEEGPVG